MNGHSSDVVATNFAFTRVDSCSHRKADAGDTLVNRLRGRDRPPRTHESGENPVAGGLDDPSVEPCHGVLHDRVVLIEKGPPTAIAELRSGARRVDDVGEEDRGEDPIDKSREPACQRR